MEDLQFILYFNRTSTGVLLTREDHGAAAPDGFDTTNIKWERSKKYHGVFRSFSIALKFVKKQAWLIREEFYTYGLDADISVEVQKLNRTTLQYYTEYTGKLDFSTFKDTDTYCEVNFIDGGLANIIKKYEDTQFAISDTYDYGGPNDHNDATLRIYLGNQPYNPPAYRLKSLLSQIVDKMTDGGITDGTYAVKSDYLDSIEDTLLIISGKSIRKEYAFSESGLSYEVKDAIKTSLTDWFKSCDSVLCLGMNIETINGVETVVVEERLTFYEQYHTKSLGDAKSLSVTMNNDYNFKRLKGGWPEKDYNDESLKNIEPNTTTIWDTPNMTTANEYDFVSKYRGDYQGIQLIVDKNWGDPIPDEDDSQDDEIWIVSTKLDQVTFGGTHVCDLQDDGKLTKINATASLDPLYNARITPRHNLLNHIQFLSDCLYKEGGKFIEFTSSKNDNINNIITVLNTVQSESGDVEILPQNLFFPLAIELEVPYPEDMAYRVTEHPLGYLSFYYNGELMTGWILSLEVKLNDRASSKYRLIPRASNDLTKLVRT